jgi:hypothetical protein|tara:strand:+ start:454 stop:687 length:234 start_codon:yes stop_codon:yes gene_type:complete
MINLFEKGPQFVTECVEMETEWMFGDWGDGEGIGSSDISACVNSVVRTICGTAYWEDTSKFNPVEIDMIRTCVHNNL